VVSFQNPFRSFVLKLENMTDHIKISDEIVVSKILYIRGQKVMIDSDLAEMFGVTTKRLNE